MICYALSPNLLPTQVWMGLQMNISLAEGVASIYYWFIIAFFGLKTPQVITAKYPTTDITKLDNHR